MPCRVYNSDRLPIDYLSQSRALLFLYLLSQQLLSSTTNNLFCSGLERIMKQSWLMMLLCSLVTLVAAQVEESNSAARDRTSIAQMFSSKQSSVCNACAKVCPNIDARVDGDPDLARFLVLELVRTLLSRPSLLQNHSLLWLHHRDVGFPATNSVLRIIKLVQPPTLC